MGYTVAVHTNTGLAHQVRNARALVAGFRAHGIAAVIADRDAPADLHVVLGPWYALDKWRHANTLYIDRAYWGDPHNVSIHWLKNGEKHFTTCDLDGLPHVTVEQLRHEKNNLQLWKYGETATADMPAMSCQEHETISGQNTNDPRAKNKSKLPIRCSCVPQKGENKEGAMCSLCGTCRTNAPYGLQQAEGSGLAVPSLSLSGTRGRLETTLRTPRGTPEVLPYRDSQKRIYLCDYGQQPEGDYSAVRYHPADGGQGSLADALEGFGVALGLRTTALLDAAIQGLTVITKDKHSPVWPISGRRGGREQLLNWLAWHNWSKDEISRGDAWEHLSQLQPRQGIPLQSQTLGYSVG